jgi:hypothetical protein
MNTGGNDDVSRLVDSRALDYPCRRLCGAVVDYKARPMMAGMGWARREKFDSHCPICESLDGPCSTENPCCHCVMNELIDEENEEDHESQ